MSRVRNLQYVDEIIIHCTATKNGHFVTPSVIDQWHKERGFHRDPNIKRIFNPIYDAIGYHFLIQPNGRVDTGRAIWETGAHCRRHNTRSVGIALCGTDAYTEHQWASLYDLVQTLTKKILRQGVTLHGHREFANKTCPGFDVKEWVARGFVPLNVYEGGDEEDD